MPADPAGAPLHVSFNEHRSLAVWVARTNPGPVRRGALFHDPPALLSCVVAAGCNQTFRALPVARGWQLGANESLALSGSPGLCGACSGKPHVAMAYEGPRPEGWTSSYAVSARVT